MTNSNAKTKQNKQTNVKTAAFTAMFAALITVTTAFIKIPSLTGYVHAGDSMVYLSASVLPGPQGIVASAIGGALADLLTGYAVFALPTAIIKALNALPFLISGFILKKRGKNNKIINPLNILMLIPTSAVTLLGYFVANGLLFDWASAYADLITEWPQPLFGAIIYLALGAGLDAIKFKDKLLSSR